MKAVKEAKPPENVKQIRQFLGLSNFFRGHIQNFAQITSPLTQLTKKDSSWKRGSLPEHALRAFRHLQSLLCSQPVLAYPRADRQYALITDASFGDEHTAGGLGAILTQIDNQGKFYVIAYASCKLQKHEKNYTPFLLEMQAAIFGMETFEVHLKGRQFKLFTDHKPLEKLGKVHTKTLNRLQQMMNLFSFEIIYKKVKKCLLISFLEMQWMQLAVICIVLLKNRIKTTFYDISDYTYLTEYFLTTIKLLS